MQHQIALSTFADVCR